MTPAVPAVWFTLAMVQLAAPLALVVAVQLWSELPEPRVKVTVCPRRRCPGVGSLVVSTPESVAGCPLVTDVVPV